MTSARTALFANVWVDSEHLEHIWNELFYFLKFKLKTAANFEQLLEDKKFTSEGFKTGSKFFKRPNDLDQLKSNKDTWL